MISLICCLLALSSSAFARTANYGSYGSASFVQTPSIVRDLPSQPSVQSGYGQSIEVPSQLPAVQQDVRATSLPTQSLVSSNYGSYGGVQRPETLVPSERILVNIPSRVFISPQQQLLEQQQLLQRKIEESQVVTEADTLCRGQQPEHILTLDNGRRWVVCLADGKGTEQWCPQGLFFHLETRRCERKLGTLDNPCLSQPCLNGGQCIKTDVSTYTCQCQVGFDGKNCELDARVCHTQNPCGSSPDARCQSFRFGAALEYICIFRNGQGYGLNPSQIQSSPCNGLDGPRGLAISNKGFIMCDGDLMFVESCPGGTIWDDQNQACVWPDMSGYGSYGEQTPVQSYGQRTIVPQLSTNIQIETPRRLVETPRVVSNYGQTQIETPKRLVETPRVLSNYGQTHVETPRVLSNYGQSQIETPRVLSNYGQSQIETPRVIPTVNQVPVESRVNNYGGSLPESQPIREQILPKFQQPMQRHVDLRTAQPQLSGY